VKYFENFTLDQFFPVSSKILCFLLRWPGKILTFCAIIFLSLNSPRRYLFNREQKMLLLRYTYQVNQEFFSYCFQLSARIYPMTPVGILLLDSQLETNLLHQMIDISFFAMNIPPSKCYFAPLLKTTASMVRRIIFRSRNKF